MREIKFRAWTGQNLGYSYNDNLERLFALKRIAGNLNESPVIFEQFTGLHDKNGKEIYEWDVVKDSTGLCLVVWNPFFACFSLRRDGWMFDHFFGEAVDPFNCEVLGNIHENPELLNAR